MKKTSMSKSTEARIERYTRGLALEKMGFSNRQISFALGYSNDDNYRKLKQKMETVLAKTRQVDMGKSEPAKSDLSILGEKVLAWLSPKNKNIETTNAILDLLLEEMNHEIE